MTTTDTQAAKPKARARFRLPDPPERHPDDMTSFHHLARNGNVHHLAKHLGNEDTTLVEGDRYVVVRPTRGMAGSHYPDMIVAFDVDPALYKDNNGYVIDEQGKPPDFVLEIASRHTGHVDVGVKREAYEALGITEYWRFDETGKYHGTRLAGDRLEGGRYEPIEVKWESEGVLQGYSAALDLNLRWEHGRFVMNDPRTNRRIATFEDERAGRMQERAGRMRERAAREQAEAGQMQAEAEREQERAGRMQERAAREQAEAREMQEQAAREQAEARLREVQAELRRLRGD